MIFLYSVLSSVIVLAVCVDLPLGYVVRSKWRWAFVLGGMALVIGLTLQSGFYLYWVAVVAPFSVMLPAVAMRRLTRQNIAWTPFSVGDKALGLLVLIGLYCSALGVFDFDVYRYGYQPLGAGAVALSGILYGWWRGNMFLSGVFAGAQVMWLFGVESSNFFDYISHVFLVPVLAWSLVGGIIVKGLRREPHP